MKILLLLSLLLTCLPMAAQESATPAHPIDFSEVDWQEATADQMALFQPYIGRFRGSSYQAEDGREFHYTVHYRWYDSQQSLLHYQLHLVLPATDEERLLGEGFYRYDPISRRIAVHGIFTDGRSGSGFVSPFNLQSGEREVRVHARQPDNSEAEVRDTFWVIDEDHWGNRTFVSMGGGDWQQVSEDTYSRIKD